MYYELIKWLREEAKFPYNDNRDLFCKAADAIEELQGKTKVLEKLADHWCNKAPKWIPVTERLPEEDQDVLVCWYEEMFVSALYSSAKKFYWEDRFGEFQDLRDEQFWMPLPQPPEDGPLAMPKKREKD